MSLVQPIWITPPGSLGTVPEGTFYQVPLQVEEPGGDQVFFQAIAGSLPSGIECTKDGNIQGVPTNVVTIADDAIVAGVNVTSKFAIRSYTTTNNQPDGPIQRLADRTFTLTVAGQNLPSWITPAGEIGQFFVGELLEPGFQLEYTNDNTTGIPPAVTLYSGTLPPGIVLSPTGLLSGFFELNPTFSAAPGYSANGVGFSTYPFDFGIESQSTNYQFSLQVTDGRTSAVRSFSMFVWSTTDFNASTTLITADNTELTASISNINAPVLLNPQGSIGTAPNSTFFAYQFIGKNVTGDQIGYLGNFLPPGLYLDNETGWLSGYLPNLGLTEQTYNFSIAVYNISSPDIVSIYYQYSLTISGPISTNVTWLTPSFLGSISNGSTSTFYVAATNTAGLPLQYRIASGSDSRLPQGLSLLPSGHIVGRVSFNTFALDDGNTTFDSKTTTFDLTCTFTVNAYSINGYVSVYKTFTINVLRTYNKPYENLYIQCMPPVNDRALIANLLENNNIFTPSLLYRSDDPNFGLSRNVIYYHAYGLDAVSLDTYVESLQLNHYWKNLALGEIKTAQAVDPVSGQVIYEVVYSEIIDNLVNNEGVSVSKEVVWPYGLVNPTVDVVYPNALEDMRNQVIDVVGQESNILPLWMQSKQANGQVLGFTPAWVIAYTIPGGSGQIEYNIETQFGDQLNQVDFVADRYELDSALTVNWDADAQSWIPSPPISTTFDINYHYDISIAASGIGYRGVERDAHGTITYHGDRIKISGTLVGGTTPLNNILIVVDTVNSYGGIVNVFYYGTGNLFAFDNHYNSISGTTLTGSGTGAFWNVLVVPGLDATVPATTPWVNNTNVAVGWKNNSGITVYWTNGGTTTFDTQFDGGSLTFNAPADIYTNTDAYNKYLLFPKRNILG